MKPLTMSDLRWNLGVALDDDFVPRNFIILLSPNQQSHCCWYTVSLSLALCSHLEVEVPAWLCGGADPGAVQDQITASCPVVTPLAEGQEG